MEGTRILNIPNSITLLRIGLTAAFVAAHFLSPERPALAAVCLAAAGCTDFADGMAARRLNQVTQFGMLLDPLADKLMVLSAVVCLMTSGAVNVGVGCVVILKDLYMLAGGAVMLKSGYVIPADFSGKIATFLFLPSALLAYPWHGIKALNRLGIAGIYLFSVLSLGSAAHYTRIAVKKSDRRKTD